MKHLKRFVLIFLGLFYFSEGKPCPEKTRAHKTRCNAYFKCLVLPSKSHVWVPEKCEQGLVYEPNLKMCVLPGDDWECILGDNGSSPDYNKNTSNDDDNVVYGASVSGVVTVAAKNSALRDFKKNNNSHDNISNVTIITKNTDAFDEYLLDVDSVTQQVDSVFSNDTETNFDSSGDGELVDLDSYHLPETKDISADTEHEIPHISSGGSSSKIDPKLTAHLQRLSQLIDGLQQTYQNKNSIATEMQPHQLNAFLAHFDIKTKFDSLEPDSENKNNEPMNLMDNRSVSSKSGAKNKTNNELDLKLSPETKVVISNVLSKRFRGGSHHQDYSNSQIVVNRPEGSIFYNLPQHNEDELTNKNDYYKSDPKISEETLKTVIELSKQMLADQNNRQIIPNPSYFSQPAVQPIYLPAVSYANRHFVSYGNPSSSNEGDYFDENTKYNKIPLIYLPSMTHHKQSGKYSTPNIHSNIIPVQLGTNNSGEKENVGNHFGTSSVNSGKYHPTGESFLDRGDNYQSGYSNRLSNRYVNNKFITHSRPIGTYQPSSDEVSTARPFDYHPSPSTIADFYTPSPHLDESNANIVFQADQNPTVHYNNMPRPNILSRPDSFANNNYQQSSSAIERPSQLQHQQQYYSQIKNPNLLFPSQIDHSKVKIRPNSQKVESMELDSDDENNSYSSDSESASQVTPHKQIVENQLAQSLDRQPSNADTNRHPPYMPRPQPQFHIGGGGINKYQLQSSPIKLSQNGDDMQLVNIGGNFINYDIFKKTIHSMLGTKLAVDVSNIEVITCAVGVRQPNTTDCTRYYVCSKKDGKVLSYLCPPYTGFNTQTRICDARTFSICNPEAIVNQYTVSENKRIEYEALKALHEAKRRREQALKAQIIANLLQADISNTAPSGSDASSEHSESNAVNGDTISSYFQQAPSITTSATQRPPSTNVSMPAKRRKYYCREGDKIPDQTSIYSYFVCYKNQSGMMKGHKMTCSKGLLFCPKTSMCTLPSKCSQK